MLMIISDACVLIDMVQADLSLIMFSLPYQFCIPDIVFMEELNDKHGELLVYGLSMKTMSGELIADAYALKRQHRRVSSQDLLALILAKDLASPLLTGDKALRELAEDLQLEVHGTIWLVEQIIRNELISLEIATQSFQKMKNSGSRLPWNEVQMMLDRYKFEP